jgi:hypothetical protein
MTEATPSAEPTFNQAHNHLMDRLHYEARHEKPSPLTCKDWDCVTLRTLITRAAHVVPLMEALERALFYIENPAGFKEQYGDPDEPESSISWGHWRDRVVTEPIRAALLAAQKAAS